MEGNDIRELNNNFEGRAVLAKASEGGAAHFISLLSVVAANLNATVTYS